MKVAVAFIYPLVKPRTYYPLALRFAQTYRQFPAGCDHELCVICNGRQPQPTELSMFETIPHRLMQHDNDGWDIGAFLRFARTTDADLLVCFGSHIHFYKPKWLAVMAGAFLSYGPGLYGCTSYWSAYPHIRTTMFWLPPQLLLSYPHPVTSARPSRYQFEHGKNSLTRHVQALGFPTYLVTWKGCFAPSQWQDNAPTCNEVLVRDQHLHGE